MLPSTNQLYKSNLKRKIKMTTKTIIHTSPAEIKEVDKYGLLGTYICFSDNAYAMGKVACEYHLEVDDSEIIAAKSIYYADETPTNTIKELISYLARYDIEIDEDQALDLLSERDSIWDYDVDSDDAGYISWQIQAMTAKAGKELGYSIVQGEDEQGAVYFVDLNVYLPKMKLIREL